MTPKKSSPSSTNTSSGRRGEEGGGDCAAQSLAPLASGRATAQRNHAEEHPDDRTHGRGQNGNRAPLGKTGQRAISESGSHQIYRGGIRRARCRFHHPRSGRNGDQASARAGSAEGAPHGRRQRRRTRARCAVAAGAQFRFLRQGRTMPTTETICHAPEIQEDAARRQAG